jgi:hypothetical protein
VANNTSATGTTNQTLPKGNAARVHTVWDITGDHTGAANTARGNLPCDLTQPISATNPCGYMLVINSAYRTDKAFRFNVTGACTETYYEITGWFKNICYKCGCDSAGRFTSTAGYIPTAPVIRQVLGQILRSKSMELIIILRATSFTRALEEPKPAQTL